MTNLPQMTLGHVGLFVTDLEKMKEFYTGVLGFTVTDSGVGRSADFVFLSRDPNEHHQVVLATGRPDGAFGTVNQISFRVAGLGDLRAMHRVLVDAGVDDISPIDHGNAWSVYFNDPEGNRIEVYMATPWYIAQPHAEPLDMSLSDDELTRHCEQKARNDPSFEPVEAWSAGAEKQMGVTG